MISITCTQCQTVLTIDDAFAGGVCRCQHCGTIQTVPSRPKATATPQPYANPSSSKSKALYQNEAARANMGTAAAAGASSASGLDDLASAVASSSGLSGSGLQGSMAKATAAAVVARQAPAQTRTAEARPAAAPSKKSKMPIIMIGVGVVILCLVGVIVWQMIGHGGPGTSNGGAGGASFCGEPIVGNNVVYVLDDANSIVDDFDPLKAATFTSIASLGADHKFGVILWSNGNEDFAFPRDGLASAVSTEIDALRTKIQDVQATGATHIRSALDRAMSRNPSAIVIVTSKTSFRNDEDDEAAVASARESSAGKVKFYTFTVGAAGDNNFLKMTAESSGGKYKHLTSQELRAATP